MYCCKIFYSIRSKWKTRYGSFKFTKNILENKPIHLFNFGKHVRDFTYIDDVVGGIFKIIKKNPKYKIPFDIFNIGNGNPKKLIEYLKQIEKNLNKNAKIKKLPLQVGDVFKTHADVGKLNKKINYRSKTNINDGVKKFVEWYLENY